MLAGIKTDTLDAVKTQIIASKLLHSDFAACVILYKDFISQARTNSNGQSLLITGVSHDTWSQGEGKKRSGAGNGGGQVQPSPYNDRFYSRKEYRKLTPGNRVFLKNLRDKRTGLKDL